ncbi:MAG: GNAT family N-acetyltransferase [Sandaracinus sp.]|nr:GNAT family N-acetyltransferase [Sandaracinus sp.]MCB9619365.1 GNAT family N-acetyltransferase [Sandaracinus sp.]MCB9621929.1 GNAT family N-acetyltransferase [Sandaracinus sp.]MCB9636637.1 GNAT family N-acetyltransferase [Sandaracinus sp.]
MTLSTPDAASSDRPDLRTARLRVHMPHPGRAADALAYFERNRAHLEPWEPARPTGFYTLAYWERRLAANRDEWDQRLSVRLFLEEGTRLVGSCNFTNAIGGAFQSCMLGYSVDARAQGGGRMHEALSVALPFVMQRLGLHRVQANYQPTNTRSGALLRRLGFRIEGYARDYLYIDGAWRDHVLTSFVRPDAPVPTPP